MVNRYALTHPPHLWTRAQILGSVCPVSREPGLYAWYFREVPIGVPTDGCITVNGATLLYVGISPRRPPTNGKPPSRQRLFHRVRYHMRGNAEGSTLRLTLGCLLADQLGITLRRVGSGRRRTFADGEAKLSDWLDVNARVATWAVPTPWEVEEQLIREIPLPLNLEHNQNHPFHATLSEHRRVCKAQAAALPIWRAAAADGQLAESSFSANL